MALIIQSIQTDLHQNRAIIFFTDNASNTSANVTCSLPLTGNETMNQVQDMAKRRAKEVLQEAIALL